MHLVSAWAARQRLVLGQEAIGDKSSEITAIPHLLEWLELTGALVTIDVNGCQRDVAEAIRGKGADYLSTAPPNAEAAVCVFPPATLKSTCQAPSLPLEILDKELDDRTILTPKYGAINGTKNLSPRRDTRQRRDAMSRVWNGTFAAALTRPDQWLVGVSFEPYIVMTRDRTSSI